MADFPGAPALLDPNAAPTALPDILSSDTIGYFAAEFGEQWGIFQGGAPVITCDNVVAFEYKQGFTVSNYPVERGSFESYDKVQTPFTGGFRFSTGGSEADRTAFLASIDAIIGNTTLYDIATPEKVYQNVTLSSQGYRRSADQGAGLLAVDVVVEEIRQATSTGLDSTAQPSGADPVNDGTVQTTTPTGVQDSTATQALAAGSFA